MPHTVELNTDGSARAPGPDPLIGRELLHYRVVEVIGQGGMSVVYRGHDEHLHRDVAIKVLHPFLAEKAECRMRLAREARAVARLEHPHILKVFDFSGDAQTVEEKPGGRQNVRGFAEGFIIAELVRGSTLKRWAEEHEVWKSPELGAMIVWQVLCALQHAHEHGVVHRDLKPENVMVREDGWLKLMDFGIAQIADQKGLTITGTLLGSPAYMAPECIEGHEATAQSDLFSMGTVLYWITTGCLPFEALTPHALLKQIVEGRAMPAQQRSPRISDDLGRVIAKAMANKPQDRFENVAAFVTALEQTLERAGVPASSERLRTILGAPADEVPRLMGEVRAAFLKRAEQALDDGAPARALSCLSRVLADDASDADARALLERAQSEASAEEPVTEPPDEPAKQEALQLASLEAAGEITAARATAPRPVTVTESGFKAPRPVGRTLMQASLVLVAVGLIAGAVVIASRFDDGRERTDTVPTRTDDPVESGDSSSGISTGTPSIGDDNKAQPGGRDKDREKGKRDDARGERERKKREGKVVVVDPPKVTPPPATPAEAPQKRIVTLRVKPWADMFVDGAQVASSSKKADVELSVGAHVVTFKNPGAKDAEVKLDVLPTGPLPEVAVELEPKPAYLVVNCNLPDAFVSVRGQGGKTAQATKDAALVVPLGAQSTARLEVVVHKKGFGTFLRNVDFQAGRTLTLDVVLEPEANDPGGAPPPAGTP